MSPTTQQQLTPSLPPSRAQLRSTQASLQLYANHPAHTALVSTHIKPILEKIIAVDYETETDTIVNDAAPSLSWTCTIAAAGMAAGLLLARVLRQ